MPAISVSKASPASCRSVKDSTLLLKWARSSALNSPSANAARNRISTIAVRTGVEKPDKGEIAVGPTVKLAYVDQSRDKLDGAHNVFQEISGGLDILNINGIEVQSRAYLGRFNFKGQDQQKMVGNLSGGERGRLHLAKTLLQGGNVLLLDEPSNDLDIETLRALEDALLEFPGNAFVISHDRWFLDRIATHILAFEGDSHVEMFQGNYREYEEDKKRRLGADADQPHRIRFKALKK